MNVTLKDINIRDLFSGLAFNHPTLIIDGVGYLVYNTEITVDPDDKMTVDMEASRNWVAATNDEKEETKMLNIEKYREEILNAIDNAGKHACIFGHIRKVIGRDVNCHRACIECIQDMIVALSSECKSPLLENGDGLKPGDWIMVRDGDDKPWVKMQFIGYFNDLFFAKEEKEVWFSVGWKQARLPEEGE